MVVRRKILVVEDNEINRLILREILTPEYTVLEAANGKEALDILRRYKDQLALILLDIVMPVMDGYTFLNIMKSNPVYAAVPVIVTTQSESDKDEIHALSYGATDFVAKPYKAQIIRRRVASIISLRETAAMINQFQFDRLTGLYSKEFFYQKVREVLNENPDKKYDIVCSDIENFKLVNDIFGLPAGDSLLMEVAEVYREFTGENGISGRLNADQFACVMEHREYENVFFAKAAERINTHFDAKSVVIKWGIYPVRDTSITIEQMCDRALLVVRSIKGRYGRDFAFYDAKLRDQLLREQMITDSMEEALEKEQFSIYLQPKYRLADGALTGAEALVRWEHPKWGLLPPSEFIPLFEKNGFVTRLDQYVWDKACAVLKEWQEKAYPSISISVNVSRADVYHTDLADNLLRIIRKYKLHPSSVHLEITESAYTENPEQIIETVGDLRAMGFIIEMDDFGSGYSSLNMLNRMPLDILKLDMKFIQTETAKPVDQGILHFIMELARWMNLSVVAEGVETQEQLQRLQDLGCDYIQGFYCGRPMPCGEFEKLFEKGHFPVAPEPRRDAFEVHRRKVLLVADRDENCRAQIRKIFEGRFDVAETDTARDTLDYIERDGIRLAALILSLNIPTQRGMTLEEMLEGRRIVWNFPVIITSEPDIHREELALEKGASDFISKPYSLKTFCRRVWRAIDMNSAWERERLLKDAAYRDYLTGFLNRRGLEAAVEALEEEDMPAAVYIFDLDNLKLVNDTFGHAQGDELLRRFGKTLNSYTREADVIARFGGDEFVILMKKMGSEEAIMKKGDTICQAVQRSYFNGHLHAACSVGAAVCRKPDEVGLCIRRADKALYRAKLSNKGSCCIWDGEVDGEEENEEET